MTTKVVAKCHSKKEVFSYSSATPNSTQIELHIPYDPKSIYYQLSGGTTINLNTINKAAADMFIIGNDYDILISPSVPELATV